MDADELVALLRYRVKRAGGEMPFAVKNAVSVQYVHNVLVGRCKPGPKIAIALGLRPVRSFEPIK